MKDIYLLLGTEIRTLRTQKNVSQEVLSGLSGIARSHLSMIENGTKHANMDTLFKICSALDVKLSDVLLAMHL